MMVSTLGCILKPISKINDVALSIGRQISWVLVALMVLAIGLQVFCRYILNSALPWPEEFARVMMIWMMALTAPSAYRWGGFVAIDMFLEALPKKLSYLLNLALTAIATCVLVFLLYYAIRHFNSGWIFKSSTLKIPLAYIYLSMSICFGAMLSVNIELIIRILGKLFGGDERFDMPKQAAEFQGE